MVAQHPTTQRPRRSREGGKRARVKQAHAKVKGKDPRHMQHAASNTAGHAGATTLTHDDGAMLNPVSRLTCGELEPSCGRWKVARYALLHVSADL
eukprot:1196196-Pleurochrysis_carterae.AAC.1